MLAWRAAYPAPLQSVPRRVRCPSPPIPASDRLLPLARCRPQPATPPSPDLHPERRATMGARPRSRKGRRQQRGHRAGHRDESAAGHEKTRHRSPSGRPHAMSRAAETPRGARRPAAPRRRSARVRPPQLRTARDSSAINARSIHQTSTVSRPGLRVRVRLCIAAGAVGRSGAGWFTADRIDRAGPGTALEIGLTENRSGW